MKALRLTQAEYDQIVARQGTSGRSPSTSPAAGGASDSLGLFSRGVTPASKYRNVHTIVDGMTFDSKREAARYLELQLQAKVGQIFDLRMHTRWPLSVRGCLQDDIIGHYESDFDYFPLGQDVRTIEDVKGMDTALSKWKRKHFHAQYGIVVAIIKRK